MTPHGRWCVPSVLERESLIAATVTKASRKGKKMNDPAMADTKTYERLPGDFYETPAWCTERLLDTITFDTQIWEPAAGGDAITNVLRRYGYDVLSSDIRLGDDFLGDNRVRSAARDSARSIITNPPYTLAEEFIEQALADTFPYGKVAMLLRNEFDCAKRRRHLFETEPFAHKLVLTKRPLWIENTTGSPRHNYSWYIWNHDHVGPATIQYA